MRTVRVIRYALAWVFVVVLGGCGEGQPSPLYPSNLSDSEGDYLLPTASTVHYAHDAAILAGQTQATVVKRDDAIPPRQESSSATDSGAASTGIPQVQPANSLNEAFANVGKALVSGLISGQPAQGETDSGAANPPTESSDSGAPSSSDAGGALDPADQAAIAALIDQYNAAIASRDLQPLTDLHTAAQQELARQHYTLLSDLADSLDALGETIETKEAGAKARMDLVIDDFLRGRMPTSAEEVTATGPDSATAGQFNFVRESGEWKIEYAQDYQAHVDQVRALAASVQTGVDGLIDQVLDSGMAPDAAIAEAKKLIGAQ